MKRWGITSQFQYKPEIVNKSNSICLQISKAQILKTSIHENYTTNHNRGFNRNVQQTGLGWTLSKYQQQLYTLVLY